MTSDKQSLTLIWQNIEIQVLYNPDYSPAHKKYVGHRLAHLEVKSDQRLPITHTGYRSHFTAAADIEQHGTPIDFVKMWLAEAEKSKEWQEYKKSKEQPKQLSLF